MYLLYSLASKGVEAAYGLMIKDTTIELTQKEIKTMYTDRGGGKYRSPETLKGKSTYESSGEPMNHAGSWAPLPKVLEQEVWGGACLHILQALSPFPNCKVTLIPVVCGPYFEKHYISPLTKHNHSH